MKDKMAPKRGRTALWIFLNIASVCYSADESPEECKDLLDNCEMYGETACVGKFRPWASVRCRAYCGFCQPPPTSPRPCHDMIPNCYLYQDDTCTDPDYFMWARWNCFKYCNFCTPETTTSPPTTPMRTPHPIRTPPLPVSKVPPTPAHVGQVTSKVILTPPNLPHRTPKHPPLLTPRPIRTPPPLGRRSPRLRRQFYPSW